MIIKFNSTLNSYSSSFTSGFILDKTKPFIVYISDKSHLLEIKDSYFAWPHSSKQEKSILNSIIKNETFFKARSYDTRGNLVIDYYSTQGLVEAINFMQKHCTK